MTIATEFAGDWIPLDGALVTVDGLRWKIRVMTYDAVYPVRQSVTMVSLEPTARTKRSAQYVAVRADLRDDWSIDALSLEPEQAAHVIQQADRYIRNIRNSGESS